MRLIVHPANIGMVGNFNFALEQARGEFVVWLCSDDFLYLNHLQSLWAYFEREPGLDVVYSPVLFTDAAERVYGIKTQANMFPCSYVDARDELLPMLVDFNQLCLPGALFRRSVFAELGGMDPAWRIGADWELAVRLAISGKRFAYHAEPMVGVRVHGANASGPEFHVNGASFVEWVAVLEKFADHPGMARVRGSERAIVDYMEGLRTSALAVLTEPFPDAFERRYAALRDTLMRRAADYRPAVARGRTVSVVIPYASRPAALMDAIDAVAAQTYPHWEIVVLDAGSIPASPLLESHPLRERIRHVRLIPRMTAGANRNFGVRMARGAYLTFLDEDNVIAPDHLASLIDALDATGAEVAGAGSRLVVDEANTELFRFEPVAVAENVFRGPADPPELGLVANALPLNALLHHRRLFEDAGRFNEAVLVLEDFDYITRLQTVGRFAFTGRATLDVHVRLGLRGQSLGVYGRQYPTVLASLYEARVVEPPIEALRARHLAVVRSVIGRIDELAATPAGVVDLMWGLAGREVIAPAQARAVASG